MMTSNGGNSNHMLSAYDPYDAYNDYVHEEDVYIDAHYDIASSNNNNNSNVNDAVYTTAIASYAAIILGGISSSSSSNNTASNDIYQRFIDAQNERGYVRTSTSNADAPYDTSSTIDHRTVLQYIPIFARRADMLSNIYANIVMDDVVNPWLDYFYVPVDPIDDYEYNTMIGELMGGNVEVGVNDVNQVSSILHEAPEDFTRCPVCQEDAERNNVYRKTLCGHVFCDACLSKWLEKHKKCPVCMQDLQDLYDAATPPSSLVLLSDPEEEA